MIPFSLGCDLYCTNTNDYSTGTGVTGNPIQAYTDPRADFFFFLDEIRELSRRNDGKLTTGLHPFW